MFLRLRTTEKTKSEIDRILELSDIEIFHSEDIFSIQEFLRDR